MRGGLCYHIGSVVFICFFSNSLYQLISIVARSGYLGHVLSRSPGFDTLLKISGFDPDWIM